MTASIYKICCNDVSVKECYIGSTRNIVERRSTHKRRCLNDWDPSHLYPVYTFIRENGGWSNWTLVPIREISLEDRGSFSIPQWMCMEERKELEATPFAILNKKKPIWIEKIDRPVLLAKRREVEIPRENEKLKDPVYREAYNARKCAEQQRLRDRETPEEKETRNAKHRVDSLSGERHEAVKAAARKRHNSKTVEEKLAIAERQRAYTQDPENKARAAAKQRERFQDPEVKARKAETTRIYQQRPEVKAKSAEANKAYLARKKEKALMESVASETV